MKAKKVTAILVAAAITATAISGCGLNKKATVATMGDQEITLGIVNFMCRFQQAAMDDMYGQYFGSTYPDYWNTDIQGQGSTMADTTKDSVVEQVHEFYTLKAHMSDYKVEITSEDEKKIKETAEKFMESNSKKALSEMGADEELVEEMLRLYTIQSKMSEVIRAEADTKVDDAEANMRAYSMIKIATDAKVDEATGESVEYTDEEKKQFKETAGLIDNAVNGKKKTSLEDVAKDNKLEVTNGTYAADDTALDEKVKKALDGLKEGETSHTIETDTAYYILRLDKETDEKATEQNRKSIITSRQDEVYNKKVSEWQEKDGWTVDEKVLAKIKFSNFFTAVTESDEANSETVGNTATEEVTNTTESAK